jgi:hypothetical protein
VSKGYTGEYEDELADMTGGRGEEEVPEYSQEQRGTHTNLLFSPYQAECTVSKGYTGEYEDELDDMTVGRGEEEVLNIVRSREETILTFCFLLTRRSVQCPRAIQESMRMSWII